MKVLFLNYEYPPIGSGASNATFCILHEYAKLRDLDVVLITSSATSGYVRDSIVDNITIHRLPVGKNAKNLHLQTRINLILYTIKAYFFARKLIRAAKKEKQPFDLTHSFFTVPCGFISMLLKFEFGLPYIVSLRGSDVPGYSDRFVFIYKFITPIIKFIWHKATFVIANSQGLKELAEKSRPSKEIGIIYNGVEIDRFKPDASLKDGNKFLITVGASRITHRKGFNYLIEAIGALAPNYPNIYAKIMGEGNAKEDLERLADQLKLQERVQFLGRIPREDLAPYYQEASVFVLPSLNEGMSNAMLEALASGLPILATDTGGTRELVVEGENGFIIKMKDAADIAEKIKKLLDNPELLEKMSRNSRAKAETLSWQKVAKDYFELYKKIYEKVA